MDWRCFLGAHRPSTSSIARREAGFHGLCDGCGLPLERNVDGRWRPSPPLAIRRDLRIG